MKRKLFIGYQLNFPCNLNKLEPLIKIPFDGKEYIGLYLQEESAPLPLIFKKAKEIEAIIQPTLDFSLNRYAIHLIGELLIG